MNPWLEEEILHQLAKLALEQQQQVLHFARALAMSTPLGVPGKELRRFAGLIELDDLRTIARAIEDGCEQVNLHEW
ncbi:MAG: hypothetical protein HYZ81_19285 [Nitrospinae bacterium]|nr:hypothetical protein [Nitrospinota bacterium]